MASDIHKIDDYNNHRVYNVVGPDGLHYIVLGQTLCSVINDCTAALTRVYEYNEWFQNLYGGKEMPGFDICFEGSEYNAKSATRDGKIFVMATRSSEIT